MAGTKIKNKENEISEPMMNPEGGEQAVSTKKAKAVKKASNRHKSKKYAEVKKLVDKTAHYSLTDALDIAKKSSMVKKFDPTVEIHLNLNTDPKNQAHQMRTTVTLPHSVGRSVTVIAFGKDSDKVIIKESGAIEGTEEMLAEFETGKVKNGSEEVVMESGKVKVIATPDWMPRLARVAKILGPKGLMPNPKSGTVTDNIAKTLEDFKGGLVEIKSQDGHPIIHTIVGKLSMEHSVLEANIKHLYTNLEQSKPQALKKPLVKSMYITTTMGPALKLDITTLA